MSRRGVHVGAVSLRPPAAALAALLAAAGAAAGCGSPTYTVRGAAAQHPGPPPPLGPPLLRALHLADFGDPTGQQAEVARGVAAANQRARFDLALFPGDNLYEDGPDAGVAGASGCRFGEDGNTVAPGFTPPADPTFARHEAPLAPLAGVPVYLSLGNHDVHAGGAADPVARARLKACLEVAHRSPAWSMPGRHYVVDRGPARFIVIDTNLLGGDYGGFTLDAEVAFVAQAAAACGDKLCFLVGHHPPVTAGSHHDEVAGTRYQERMGRLVGAGGGRIQAFLAGHDHDLQHLRTSGGLDVLVSGNGSRGRRLERFGSVSSPGATLLFASVRWGYGVLEVAADGWSYRFEDPSGAALYCCAARGGPGVTATGGRCEPVVCRPSTSPP